jgi:pyridoxamine 5'-phosphate oxidase
MSDFKFPSWRQRLVRSLHVNRSQAQSKYFQVASVSKDGLPKNRTMVFRGFIPESLNLVSVTDIRSEKVSDWQLNTPKKFEICWYFASSREQYRIAGQVSLVSNEILKKVHNHDFNRNSVIFSEAFLRQQWTKLSNGAQEQFFWPSPRTPFDGKVDDNNSGAGDGLAVVRNAIGINQDVLSGGKTNNKTTQTKATKSESQINSSEKSTNAESAFEISDHFCVVIFTPLSVDYLNLKGSPQLRCLSDLENNWLELVVNA